MSGERDCEQAHPWGPESHVTLRESTEQERTEGFGPHPLAEGDRRPNRVADRYVLVDADDSERLWFVFGLPQGGNTREEAVFWAERFASKNGAHFLRPEGWEQVVGALPE